MQKLLGIKNLYAPEHVRSVYHMDQALKAQTLFKRDKDYVVTMTAKWLSSTNLLAV